ncbi:CidA/LrgA family protein [Halioxenophilus sp. WMMB6]|uniref:CidA/LrgA family protein n=1 Tax=Halioxenophilus sp. WMMB6 TaxID=3073815 RepID=UPI00295EC240|nr:CidA/LrgA family protein [Halioxenophilus sp. WMMB6]
MVIKGLLWLFGFQLLGELIVRSFGWLVPGPVVGLVLLFAVLLVVPTPQSLTKVSDTLVKNIAVMFLPAGAGLFFLPESVIGQWPALLAAVVGGTAISITLCALLLKWMCRP